MMNVLTPLDLVRRSKTSCEREKGNKWRLLQGHFDLDWSKKILKRIGCGMCNIEKGLSFEKNSMNIFHTKPTLNIGNAFLSRKKC